MAPERERPTRRQIKEGRTAQQAADRLAREVHRMEQRSDELGAEIEQTRSDWQRKRADNKVPGAIPPESQEGTREGASDPAKDQDENAAPVAAEEDESGSAGADEDDENPSA
jgi:hypothetical protein